MTAVEQAHQRVEERLERAGFGTPGVLDEVSDIPRKNGLLFAGMDVNYDEVHAWLEKEAELVMNEIDEAGEAVMPGEADVGAKLLMLLSHPLVREAEQELLRSNAMRAVLFGWELAQVQS
jgi:hypothetical protein